MEEGSSKKRLFIVGAGDGGIMLANRLKGKFDITLIDPSTMHYFQPWQLHIAFKGAKEKSIEKRKLLPKSAKLIIDEVKEVDVENRKITTSTASFDYDYVVVDTGSHGNYSKIPGHADLYNKFGDYHSNTQAAQRVWQSINAFRGGKVVMGSAYPIFKCPPSPIEAVMLFDEFLRLRKLRDNTEITFVTPFPRAYPAEQMNEIVEPLMKERGINIIPFFDVESIDTKAQTISSIEGDVLNYDFAVLIPPHAGAGIVKDYCDDDGFVKTDKEKLTIGDFDDAFCIGDATNIQTSKSGVTAHLQSKVLANRLLGGNALFNGRTHCPMELGDHKATFVIGSYTQPVVKLKPSLFNYLLKLGMKYMAWQVLKAQIDFIMDPYFAFTAPERLNKKQSAH